MPIEFMLCPKCDSQKIVRDAWTTWDPIKAEWTIEDLWSIYCQDCEEVSDWPKVVSAVEDGPDETGNESHSSPKNEEP